MRSSNVDAIVPNLIHEGSQNAATAQPLSVPFWSMLQNTFSSLFRPTPPTTESPPTSSAVATSSSPSCLKMIPLVKSTIGVQDISKDILLELVHMIDTGGQPELMEVMPSLIHNANLAMVLVNLQYGLNECPPINYHEEGVAYTHNNPSRYTSREVILKPVSTLHSKKLLKVQFHILIVATHRDCVEGDLETRVEALNSELHSLLLPAFENELILFEQPNRIAFVLNLKDPDDNDERALELIRRQVAEPSWGNTFETPITSFVLEQDLVKFAEDEVKRDILSLEECKQVGTHLGMSGYMVIAALVLFHCQNTFLYFQQVLPNHVFIKPQVPLDIINGIVHFSYKKLQGVPAKLARLLKNGIITEELLSCHEISPHFKKGFMK